MSQLIQREIYKISNETWNRLYELIVAGKITNVGMVFIQGCFDTDKEWIIETDYDDPYFGYDRETEEWTEYKAEVAGEFLYRSYELTDVDLPMEMKTYSPDTKVPEKTMKYLKGIGIKPPNREAKENASLITFDEALTLIKEE